MDGGCGRLEAAFRRRFCDCVKRLSVCLAAGHSSERHESKIRCHCIAGMYEKSTLSFHLVCGRHLSSCSVLKKLA